MSRLEEAYATTNTRRVLSVAVIAMAVLTPLYALLFGHYLSLVWDWFVRAEYGEGPSLKAWFGIVALCQLIRVRAITNPETPEYDKKLSARPVTTVITSAFTQAAGASIGMLFVYLTGRIMGWA